MEEPWCWRVDSGAEGIERSAAEWDRLAHAGSFSPTADSLWTASLWGAFGAVGGPLEIHRLLRGEHLYAVIPVVRRRRLIRSVSDFQVVRLTPYWQFAVREDALDAVAEAAIERLLEDAEVLLLRRLHAGGPIAKAFVGAAGRRGLTVDSTVHGADCLLPLPRTWETFRGAMSTKLRKNTERAERQLERMGSLTFDVVQGPDEALAVLEECIELETLGWKATDGDTIASRPDWRRFYTDLVRASAQHGRLALYTLRLDGRLLAYDLCLRAQRRINLLKISYHPDYHKQSPSNVLRYRVFQREVELREIDAYHFGDPSEWKLRWTDRQDPLVDLRIYARGLRGLLARATGPGPRRAVGGLLRKKAGR